MTVYGDLEVSALDGCRLEELNCDTLGGRATFRSKYGHRLDEVETGRQAYVVCPLIEESENLEVASARNLRTTRRRRTFECSGRSSHGRMSSAEKSNVEAFRAQLDVLVATTVIEVGVDVPSATVMVVLDADVRNCAVASVAGVLPAVNMRRPVG